MQFFSTLFLCFFAPSLTLDFKMGFGIYVKLLILVLH